jgi:hypothetical protein
MKIEKIRIGDVSKDYGKVISIHHGVNKVLLEWENGSCFGECYGYELVTHITKSPDRLPHRGDEILVWGDGGEPVKRIFLEFRGQDVVCVAKVSEREYKGGYCFGDCPWTNWKWPEEEEALSWETPEEIAKTVEWLVKKVQELEENK